MEKLRHLEKLDRLLARVQKKSEQDAYIYGVTPIHGRGVFTRINDFLIDHSRVPSREKAYFFELLATLLQAGIALNKSLKILTSKTNNPRLKRVIATLSNEIEHGRPLSHALDRFPQIFDETERGVIRSAEAVGHLEAILFKVAESLNRRNEIKMRLTAALVYPAAVIITLLIGVAVLLTVVVPRIEAIFVESSLALPLPTRILISLSSFFTHFWWLVAIAIIFGVIIFHSYTHSEEGRFSWDFMKLRIPLLGPVFRKVYVMRFVDTLGLLIESGLPINKALEFVAISVGNEVYRTKTYEAHAAVQEGKPLSSTTAGAPFLFPEAVTNMISVGEHSASLGEMAQKIGRHFDREIDHTLRTMTTVLGPVLILVVGLLVAFFALAVLSPIFSLTQAIQ